jgi:hypothetical protein
MRNFRNRWSYAASAAIIAQITILLFYVTANQSFGIKSLLKWSIYGMILAALLALLSWPKNQKATLRRMSVAGLSLPAIVIMILGLTFSILNPGFPDAMRDGIETNIYHIINGGIVMFFIFSFFTMGVPYILGFFLSLIFVDPDG